MRRWVLGIASRHHGVVRHPGEDSIPGGLTPPRSSVKERSNHEDVASDLLYRRDQAAHRLKSGFSHRARLRFDTSVANGVSRQAGRSSSGICWQLPTMGWDRRVPIAGGTELSADSHVEPGTSCSSGLRTIP
jgi:hypothetical protein